MHTGFGRQNKHSLEQSRHAKAEGERLVAKHSGDYRSDPAHKMRKFAESSDDTNVTVERQNFTQFDKTSKAVRSESTQKDSTTASLCSGQRRSAHLPSLLSREILPPVPQAHFLPPQLVQAQALLQCVMAVPTMQSLVALNGTLQSSLKKSRADSYKTVMCQSWLESNSCVFGENCRFAHGVDELRPTKALPRTNAKYKTKLCDKYTTTGVCPYGARCLFIHPEYENEDSKGKPTNDYIRPDKLSEVLSRHAEAERRRLGVSQSPTHEEFPKQQLQAQLSDETPIRPTVDRTGSRGSLRPHPSWPLEGFTRSGNLKPKENSQQNDADLRSFSEGQISRQSPSNKDTSTPGSGYASGGSTPTTASMLSRNQSPYSLGVSPASGFGLSSVSSYSCSSSVDGDGFDLSENNFFGIDSVPVSLDFLKDSHEVNLTLPEVPTKFKDESAPAETFHGCDFTPFSCVFNTDNFGRNIFKESRNIW